MSNVRAKGQDLTNAGYVHFTLYGDNFNPDELTKLIGITPTSTKIKGNPTPKYTMWEFSTDKIENDFIDVYEMSSFVVSKLAPYSSNIRNAVKTFNLKPMLSVALWITSDESKSTPAIGFDENVIAFLNEVGATIDVDTYIV